MTSSPASPHKRNQFKLSMKSDDINNRNNKYFKHQQANTFITWYKHMIDNERQNFTLYMSDDATLEWFGRTIKSRKKVIEFLKYDMQCSKHYFTSVESIDKIQTRHERSTRKDDNKLASPLNSPEVINIKPEPVKRRLLRSNCNSPEWAPDCEPQDEFRCLENKRRKKNHAGNENRDEFNQKGLKRTHSDDESAEMYNKGDGAPGHRHKHKCLTITPPNHEVGQGDCLPSTSGTDSDKSHEALNAQLPKYAVECNGYVEFTRTRNSRSSDAVKWERKCKVQISYSEDPLNVGEYIIWALHYTDESKCRRNLLAAFDEVSKEEEVNIL